MPKTLLVAGGLAFLTTNAGVLMFFGGIFIGQWMLYPAIYLADKMVEPSWTRLLVFYLTGLFQYFALFLLSLWIYDKCKRAA